MKYRAALLASAFIAGALAARAEETLPPGLVRQGGVIMMQPIEDSAGGNVPNNNEHRAGLIRVLSPTDRDIYVRAFEAADRGDWAAAKALASQGHDGTAAKLIEWRRLLDKNSGASFQDLDAFLKANPDWPLRDTLLARAEAAVGVQLSPAGVVAWFGPRAPVSAIGRIRLGEALIATGNEKEGRPLVQQGWIEGTFDPPDELAIVQKDGSFLTPDIDRQQRPSMEGRSVGRTARSRSRR
jgi:soluble lytic murein transglycosylase